jgi:DNA modification methylase
MSAEVAEPSAAPSSGWRNRIVGHGNVPPGDLVPNPRNWRSHPAEQQRALAGALAEVGWVAEVLVNRTTGNVVDGHLRIELALAREEPSVPVTYVDLSEEEERLVLASLDPLAAMATAEEEQLAALLAGLDPADDALRALLDDLARKYRLDALRSGLVDPDDVPAIPDEPYVRSGDLYGLGDHRLLCGDATNAADVARLLDSAEPTPLATDPPYGVSLDPTWRDGVYNALGPAEPGYLQVDPSEDARGATRAPIGAHGRTKGHRNTTVSGDTRVDWSDAFALVPSLAVGYVWHAGVHAAEVAAGLERIGFEVVSQVVWDKGLFAIGRSWYHWGHEPCWVVRRIGSKARFLGARDQSTIWRAPSPKMIMAGSDEPKVDHPTQKPVALYEAPIANHLRRGEVVYDPFLGSGTALVAAERLARRCYALEIDPRYVQVAIERWQTFTGQTAIKVEG